MIRLAVFAAMVLGLVGFGTVAYLYLYPPAPAAKPAEAQAAPPPPRKASVLDSAHALRAGTFLKPEDISSREEPLAEVPAGATLDTPLARAQLDGAMLRHSVGEGGILLGEDMLKTGDHGFLAAVLEPGTRAMTFSVNEVASDWALIWPGDRIDLILTEQFDDRGTNPRRGMASETILSDIRIVAVDKMLAQGEMPEDAQRKETRTLTVEVTSEEAQKLSIAMRLGRLGIALRAAVRDVPGSAGRRPAPTVTWSGDVAHSLDQSRQPEAAVIRLYRGSEDGREFRFGGAEGGPAPQPRAAGAQPLLSQPMTKSTAGAY